MPQTDKLIDAFLERGLLSERDVADWQAERASLPQLSLNDNSTGGMEQFLNEQVHQLAGEEFGATIQEISRNNDGFTNVRFSMDIEGSDLKNSGVMVFDEKNQLQDLQSAFDEGLDVEQIRTTMDQAKTMGLDWLGPVEIFKEEDGSVNARVIVEVGGDDPHLMVYDLNTPQGEREEYAFREQMARQGEDLEWLKNILPSGAEVVSSEEVAGR